MAAALYPDAPKPWLDLSTGINPHPWTPPAPIPVDLNALPSPAALLELEAAAARAFGTSADRVVAMPGSEIGLRSLPALDLPAPYQVVAPAYATHGETFAEPVTIARKGIDDVTGGTLLLANPNNPDGHRDPPERLLGIARRGAWLIVDEAFADAVPDTSLIPYLGSDDRAMVFRSFGKFFGLAGLRLGFMVAPPAHAQAMRIRMGSWPVSAHAIAYGTAAYRDTGWAAQARKALATRAARLDALLRRHGLDPRGDCPLFRLVDCEDADALFDRLASAGILTRPFAHSPRWVRLGVPADDTAFARLDAALAHG